MSGTSKSRRSAILAEMGLAPVWRLRARGAASARAEAAAARTDSGAAVERVHELQFQRPQAEVTLARADARAMGIAAGDTVTVSTDGASVDLRARLSNTQREGVALIADEHSQGLRGSVAITPSPRNEATA